MTFLLNPALFYLRKGYTRHTGDFYAWILQETASLVKKQTLLDQQYLSIVTGHFPYNHFRICNLSPKTKYV